MHSATKLHCIHYDDESIVFTRGVCISELKSFFNDELCKVFKFLCANYLFLNVEKSCFTMFTNKNIEVMPALKIDKSTCPFLMKLYFF